MTFLGAVTTNRAPGNAPGTTLGLGIPAVHDSTLSIGGGARGSGLTDGDADLDCVIRILRLAGPGLGTVRVLKLSNTETI